MVEIEGSVEVGAGAALVMDAPLTVGNALIVRAGGTITHASNGATELYKLRLEVGGDVTVDAGGAIRFLPRGLMLMVMRDLRVYSQKMGGKLSYYRDRYGLEADAVLHLKNGRYALIEVKLGSNEIEEGADHLKEVKRLIGEYNKLEKQCPLRLPDVLLVITGGIQAYTRSDGVHVVPISALRGS